MTNEIIKHWPQPSPLIHFSPGLVFDIATVVFVRSHSTRWHAVLRHPCFGHGAFVERMLPSTHTSSGHATEA